jgi:hypothetical protein
LDFAAVTISPADGSIWGSAVGMPGSLIRLSPGSNRSASALAEYYEVPWHNPKAAVQGSSPHGLDIDTNGVVWTVLASGHYSSFDRRKCKGTLIGPTATGSTIPKAGNFISSPGRN